MVILRPKQFIEIELVPIKLKCRTHCKTEPTLKMGSNNTYFDIPRVFYFLRKQTVLSSGSLQRFVMQVEEHDLVV